MVSVDSLAIDLGPFDVSVSFCRDTQKIGSILNAFQFASWPVAGLPGIVTGVSMRTSPVIDACNYIIQLSQADTLGAINMAADALNKVTSEKHDRAFQLSKTIFSLSNSYYDLKSGKQRPGDISAMQAATDIGNFMSTYGTMKKRWDKEDSDQESYNKQHDMISKLAQTAKERAIIADILSCPDSSKNPKFDQITKQKYEPAYKNLKTYQEDYEFALARINDLAVKIIPSYSMYEKFSKDLNKAIVSGVKYTQTLKENRRESGVTKTGQADANGEAIVKPTSAIRQIYTYSIDEQDLYSSFYKLNEPYFDYRQWLSKNWDRAERLGELEGFKKEFVAINIDCSPKAIAGSLSEDNPNSDLEFKKRKERCEQNINISKGVAYAYWDNMVDYLKNALLNYKKANALIWTLDSEYRGINRSVSTTVTNAISQEKVSCSKELSVAAMQDLALQQEQANLKYNEILATETVKQGAIAESLEEEKIKDKKAEQFLKESTARKEKIDEDVLKKMPKSFSLMSTKSSDGK